MSAPSASVADTRRSTGRVSRARSELRKRLSVCSASVRGSSVTSGVTALPSALVCVVLRWTSSGVGLRTVGAPSSDALASRLVWESSSVGSSKCVSSRRAPRFMTPSRG